MDTKARQMKGNIYCGKKQVFEQSKLLPVTTVQKEREVFLLFYQHTC